MSLTNQVVITIGCCNLGFCNFWVTVFVDLWLLMNKDTKAFLEQKDKYKTYRQKHQKKEETKRQRIDRKNKQIKR